MNKILGITAIIVLVAAVIIAGISAFDIYNLRNMKDNAAPCGFAADDYSQSCECDGQMVDSASTINPSLAETIGGTNYYCYGKCFACRCFEEDEEIDCSDV